MFKKIGILLGILGVAGLISIGWQGAVAAGKTIIPESAAAAHTLKYQPKQTFTFSRGGYQSATPTWRN